MATRVVHVNKDTFDEYIGRECYGYSQSDWHNPLKLGVDGNRKEVLKKFKAYVKTRPDLVARVHELRGRILGCWCKPKYDCHGDIWALLADAADPAAIVASWPD